MAAPERVAVVPPAERRVYIRKVWEHRWVPRLYLCVDGRTDCGSTHRGLQSKNHGSHAEG